MSFREARVASLLQGGAAQWTYGLPLPTLESVWREIARLIKFGLVGLPNTLVSVAVLNLFFFLLPPTTQIALVLGSTTAHAAGDLNSYWWNRSWNFDAGKRSWAEFARFAAVSLVAMAINAAVVWGSSGWLLALSLPGWLLGNSYQVSMALSGSLGYLACRFWVFKPPAPSVAQPEPFSS